ncbi:flagellar motor switch protein FliG [Oceanicella sp. SM1341]|uniref:flagellar motor switch protein FliG n=1 Tax=Oceanicella sp. SM1341 TaxID=1548889 RepID=UPI000E535C41|nr:FliG C-terminal domain-containing protein [Oceanicella sp. SM1341]
MSAPDNLPALARQSLALARINGEERTTDELTPTQKATIILAALGPVQAAGVLKELGEANVRRFARTIATMGRIPAQVLDQVSQEFLNELGGDYDVSGGIVTARKILSEALDREDYDRIMEDVQGNVRLSIWDKLGNAPVGSLANFIAAEHPQIGAVVLGRMRADRAARVLERLPGEIAHIIVLRMSRVPRVDHVVLEQVKQVIEEEFLSVIQRESGTKKPAELLAGLMNHVSSAAREQFLAQLEEDEPVFAAEVQRVMFTFGDIVARVVPRDITQITRELEEPVLMAALKTGMETNPKVVEFILGNLSKRLSERMSEDLTAMQAPPLKEGEAAQAELVKAIQALAQRGAIRLNQPEAADED